VLACGNRKTGRWFQYNGTAGLRLCRGLRGGAVIAAILSALAVSGCSYRLASLVATDDTDPPATGSIAPAGQTDPGSRAARAETDLAYARAVASDVLAHAGKDASVHWQNPQTGAGGNILPLDASYSEDGLPCRDFLASYLHGAAQDWLRGAACRTASGSWEVTRLAPLKSS
jgi:surface antigen